jgi:hypothetical protein
MLTYKELQEKGICWTGYKRKKGTTPYEDGSCVQEEIEKHHATVFGRMNPITAGHEAVVNKLHSVAKENNASHSLVLSHSQDDKKNPLSGIQKVKHAKRAFPKTNVSTSSKDKPTILHHASDLQKQGVTHLHVVAGSDRQQAMKDLLDKYNGQQGSHGHYNFKSITVHSSGERDPDSEGTSGMSASKMREHAASGNKTEFHKGAASTMSSKHKDAMYNDVRKGMNIHEETADQQTDRAQQLKRFNDQMIKANGPQIDTEIALDKKEKDAMIGKIKVKKTSVGMSKTDQDALRDVNETLRPEMGAGAYINDFIASTNPRFNNKNKEERRRMAIGAYMNAKAKGVRESIDENRNLHAKTILQHTKGIDMDAPHQDSLLPTHIGKLYGGNLHHSLGRKSPTFKRLSDEYYGDHHAMVKHASDEDLKQMHQDFTNKVHEELVDNMQEAKDPKEYGYEGDMAMNQLKTLVRCAEMIEDCLKPDTDLPEWVQSKITLATDYIQTAADYLYSETEMNESLTEEIEHIDENHYENAEDHKVKAEMAKGEGKMGAYHTHMVNHHELKGHWHASKGRNSAANREYEKAEQHHNESLKHPLDEATKSRRMSAAVKLQRAVERARANSSESNKHDQRIRELQGIANRMKPKQEVQENADLKDTTMSKTIKGFKFFKGQAQPNTQMTVKENLNEDYDSKLDSIAKKHGYTKTETPTGHTLTHPEHGTVQINHVGSYKINKPQHHIVHGVGLGVLDTHLAHINGTHPEDAKKYVNSITRTEATDTVTKDASGKVKSWMHTGDWKKIKDPKKNPVGIVHNMVGQALQNTKKITTESMTGNLPEMQEQTAPVGKVQKIVSKTAVIKLHPNGVATDTEEGWAKPKIKEETMKSYKEFLHSLDEKLIGKQTELDKNHNGEIDSGDFKLLRKMRKMRKEEVEQIDEVNHRDLAAQGKMHPTWADNMDVGQRTDYYEHGTGDKVEGKVIHKDKKQIHLQQTHDSYDPKKIGTIHKFDISESLDETMMSDLPSRKISGRSYGADYTDPEGADETAADLKKKTAGRKAGSGAGVYKPRKTMSKLKQLGASYK